MVELVSCACELEEASVVDTHFYVLVCNCGVLRRVR